MRRRWIRTLGGCGAGDASGDECAQPGSGIEDQLLDGLENHGVQLTKVEAKERVRSLLEHVGLKPSVAGACVPMN